MEFKKGKKYKFNKELYRKYMENIINNETNEEKMKKLIETYEEGLETFAKDLSNGISFNVVEIKGKGYTGLYIKSITEMYEILPEWCEEVK